MKEFLKKKFSTLYFFYQYIGLKVFVLLGFSFLMVLMDTIGLTMFVPLLQIADSYNDVGAKSQLVKYVESLFETLGLELTVNKILILIILLFSFKALFFYFALKYKGFSMQAFSKKIRTKLALGVRDLHYREFIKTDVGRLQSTLNGEAWMVANSSSIYLDVIKSGIFILVYLGFAIFLDWKFSILIVIGGGLSNLIYNKFYKKTKVLSREILKQGHDYGAVVIEGTNHYKYLKATGRIIPYFDRLRNVLDKIILNNIKVAELNARLSAFREPMTIVVIMSVIAIHLYIFNSTLSSIMVVLLLFYRAMQVIIEFQNGWNSYLSTIGTIENVKSFLSTLDDHRELYYGTKKFENVNSITLSNVDLSFDNYNILNNINMNINKNQSVALVGESGSGKTSLVNIISILYPPTNGNVLINNIPLSEIDVKWYKSKIGYISQEPTIFNATVFDNITFWDEVTEENLARFHKVIDMCSLSSFMDALPNAEKVLLGNNGVNVSGGQKQRISIARELYRNVDILIMDEATAALDSETENDIRESLEELKGKVTIISIAHRLSTVKSADCLYLMERGEIIASGNFEELKNKSEYFKRLTELQGM